MDGGERARRAVRDALGGRRLIWFGTRGEDVEPLEALPELAGTIALTAPPRSGPHEVDLCLEGLRGSRPDTYRYELDEDRSEAALAFQRGLLEAVRDPCVLITYGSTEFVSAVAFAMDGALTLAGPLKARQAAFGHKPWVERSLARHGVRVIDWRYLAVQDRAAVAELAAREPQVLRATRTAGGVGLALARTAADVERQWPEGGDLFVAAAPLLAGAPINFSGCVFADGAVRLHPASVQLIGIASCTEQRFGYCGNDFGAISRLLDRRRLDELDALGHQVGSWLHRERYLGAFGIDAIAADDGIVFTELNPRFQGSSALSARIAQELGVPDLYCDHLAASLGLAAPPGDLSIAAWAAHQPDLSRVVVRNTGPGPLALTVRPGTELTDAAELSQLPTAVPVEPGGALGSLTLRRSVTASGFELDAATERLVASLRSVFGPAA